MSVIAAGGRSADRRLSPRPRAVPSGPPEQATTVELLPAELNLHVYAGDDVTIQFTFTDKTGQAVNMAGTWAAQIRAQPGDPDPALAHLTIDTSQAAGGIIVATLAGDDSATLPVATPLAWDLEQTNSGATRTTHSGTITVTEDVTRP